MGKDKKERNPADQFRKEQRKKELLKLKKDRAVVKEVHDMLNDPRKIDAEIARVQKESNENKLDKSLKDRIKELQRMKEVANRKQLVLVAQGKITKEEADNKINPSIYENNSDLIGFHPSSKPESAGHAHMKSASRISTDGLPVYHRGGDATALASSIPIPTSVVTPYPSAMPPRGMPYAMGGMGGIPLPPPRPGMSSAPTPQAPFAAQQGFLPPPPLSRPGGPVHGTPAAHGIPPPPPRPAGWPAAPAVAGQPLPHVPQQGMAYPQPALYSAPYGQIPPPPYGPGVGMPYYPGYPPQMGMPQQAGAGAGKERERKARPPRGPRPASAEEIDPLDPAGRGYTERFGALATKKGTAGEEGGSQDAQRKQPPAAVEAGSAAVVPLMDAVDQAVAEDDSVPKNKAADQESAKGETEQQIEEHVTVPASMPPPSQPPQPPHPQPFAPDFGPVLSAEELMRRRNTVPPPAPAAAEGASGAAMAAPGVASFGPTLTAEELMRRRKTIIATDAADESGSAAPPSAEDAPAPGPAMPPPDFYAYEGTYGESEADGASGVGPASPPGGPSLPKGASGAGGEETETDAEELMRQKYFIPDVVAEDVDSDQEDEEGGYYPHQQPEYGQLYALDGDDAEDGDNSEDEVRSAGQPEDFPDSADAGPYPDDEDEDGGGFHAPQLEVDVGNLIPARLPASFTRLPQPTTYVPAPPPTPTPVAPPAPVRYTNALTFNDYGDDDEDGEEYGEDHQLEPEEPVVRKVQPFAPYIPAPTVAPSTSSTFSAASEISRAIVKGPKIIKADRALTALVPNALKKKRPLTATAMPLAKKTATESRHDAEGGYGSDDGAEPAGEGKAAGRLSGPGGFDPESLHAATSALLKPTAPAPAPAAGLSRHEADASFALRADARGAPATVPTGAGHPGLAPISFVPATTVNRSAAATAPASAASRPAPSAEDDVFAQFFQEINQLEPGSS